MANKYSSALEKAQKLVEEQDQRMQMRNSPAFALTKSPYSSAFEKIGALPQTTATGSSAGNSNFMTPDQAPVTNSLIPVPSSNPALNSLIAGQQIEEARRRAEEEQARQEAHRQAISQAMNTGFLSKVKGNQQNQQPVMPEIPAAPATSGVSDPLQKIIDLVSGNTANADTRNPALPEVTVNRGVAPDDWSRGIRQYTDANGNIVRDANGNAYAVDKLRQDSNTARKNVSQTGIGWLDNILDTLNYSAQKAGAGLENEIDNLFASLDAGVAGAGRLVNPNRRVQWQSYNPTQIEEPIKPLSGKAFRQAENANASSLDQSGADGLYNNKVGALNEKYGKVAENPFVQGVAGLDEAIARQLPYIAAGQIASSAALGGALSQGFANGLTGAEAMREAIASARAVGNTASAVSRALSSYSRAYKEGRADGADSIQALQYANQEAINQGIGEFLLGGIGGMGEGMLGKVAANTKVGRSLAKAIGTHITSPLLKTAIRYAGTLGGEAIEEMIQDVVTVANKRATYKPDAKISGKELVYSGVLGAAMAGVFNAPGLPATYQAYKADYDTINNLSKAAASASSFEDVQAVRRMCDLIIDECETSLGEKNISSFGTTAAKNETDLDLRMRYEYLRDGAQQIRDILGTDSTAIIEGNTKFDEDVSFATDAPVDNIVEETANIVVDVADTLEPGADVIRGTIDRVNEEIQDITQTEEDIRQMSEEEFAEWFYNSRFKNIFPGIAEAVHGSTERLLAAPRTYENDTSVVTDNETAENIVRQDIAAQMRAMLDELKTRKEVLNQINATLRNNKEDVKEGVTDILTSSGDGDTIETTNPDIQADGKSLMPETADKPVPSSGNTRFDVLRSPYEHTQTHKQFDLLQTPKGLSDEDFNAFKKAVKDNGGWFSKYAKGWLVPEGKWDGVQKALEDLNIGIRTEGTESSSAQTETPQNTTPAEGERAPEFVVGEPSESAETETITAERPDIPEFEVAGNTDMVPRSGTTEVRNGSGTAVDETGTRSDTGRGTNETADNGTVSTATAPEVDGLNAPETTTGKTNVNADSGKEPKESEKAQAKWTPDSKEKLTDDNFPYKVGDTFKRPNSGAECKIESFGGGMITLDFGNYIPLTMEYSSFASQLRNGQLIESEVSRETEQQAKTKADTPYDSIEKALATQDTVRQNGFEFRIENRPQSYVEYGGVIQRYTMQGDQPVRQGKQLYNSATQHGWSRDRNEVAKDLANFARENKLLDPHQENETDTEPPKRTIPAKTPKEGYMKFDSQAAYEEWTEQFADAYLYDHVPTLIDDGFKVSADMLVDCKRWKTAFDRFKKTFGNVEAFDGWFDQIEESAESGYFSEDWYKGGYPSGATKEEIADYAKGGTYSWGIEAVNDDAYYVYLNVSGIHAGRERQSQNAQENTSAKESETKPKDREPVAPTPKATTKKNADSAYDVLSDKLMMSKSVVSGDFVFEITDDDHGRYMGEIRRNREFSDDEYPVFNARDTLYRQYYNNATRADVVLDLVRVAENNKLLDVPETTAEPESEYAVGEVVKVGDEYYEVISIEDGEPQFAPYTSEETAEAEESAEPEEEDSSSYQVGEEVEYNGKNYRILRFNDDGSPVLQEIKQSKSKGFSNVRFALEEPEIITLSLSDFRNAIKNNQIKKVGSSGTRQSTSSPRSTASTTTRTETPKTSSTPNQGTAKLSLADLMKKAGTGTTIQKVTDKSKLGGIINGKRAGTAESGNRGKSGSGRSELGAESQRRDGGRTSDTVQKTEKEGESETVSEPSRKVGGRNGTAQSGTTDRNGNAGESVQDKEPVSTGESNTGSDERDNGERNGGRATGNDDSSVRRRASRLNKNNYSFDAEDIQYIDNTRPNENDNLEAIRTLLTIEREGRQATPEERKILSKYKGWGGLSNIFDERNSWRSNAQALKSLLSPQEYSDARGSTQNAHYTSLAIVSAMYDGLKRMGLKGGNILEPSMGTGNFLGAMPKTIANNSNLFGVEMDSITGRIAKLLYPDADISISPFQDVKYKDNQFDVIVGNVPFSKNRFTYKGEKHSLHTYFFAKGLDHLKPGGIMMAITSTGTLDTDPKSRNILANKADLIAAFRLPGGMFGTNAGTQVTTDLLVFRKRPDGLAQSNETFSEVGPVQIEDSKTGEIKTGYVNEYFIRHPENVLGKYVDNTMYGHKEGNDVGSSVAVAPIKGEDYKKVLSDAMKRLPKDIIGTDMTAAEVKVENDSIKPGFIEHDGKMYFRDPSENTLEELTGKRAAMAKDYLKIKDAYNGLIELSNNPTTPHNKLEQARKTLNTVYDAFVNHKWKNSKGEITTFGPLNKGGAGNARSLLSADADYSMVSALEVKGDEPGTYKKAPIFYTDVFAKPPVEHVDSPNDALASSLAEKGGVDLAYMEKLTGLTQDQLLEQLQNRIVETPDGEYQLAELYLSGDVRDKLETARRAAETDEKFQKNVEMLSAVTPATVPPENISVTIGASWIPASYYQQFIAERLHAYPSAKIGYNNETGQWMVEGGKNAFPYSVTYGDINLAKLLESTMNQKQMQIRDQNGKLDYVATQDAQEKQKQLRTEFAAWVFATKERKGELGDLYNKQFNSWRNADYTELGKTLKFDGVNPLIKLRNYQRTAIARVVYGGNALLGHGVGTGKTFEMIASAMECKRLGITHKNLLVVPKNKVADFQRDILKLYPNARVMRVTDQDFELSNRKRMISALATNDYDIAVIGHTQFNKIPLSKETQQAVILEQLNDARAVLADLKKPENGDGRAFSRSVKDIEKTIAGYEEKLKSLSGKEKDDTVTFENLGIDGLFVDEAHNFKNLPFFTTKNVAGVKGGTAQRATDMYMKTSWLHNKHGKVVFATATPITNTMAEIYNMTRFVSPETLINAGTKSFDAWSSVFGETVNALEVSPDGKNFRMKERFSKFRNAQQMISMFRQFADILKTADVVEDLPKEDRITVTSGENYITKEYVDNIVQRMERMKGRATKEDNMLLITNDGKAAATDLRLVAKQLNGQTDPDKIYLPGFEKYTMADLDLPDSKINNAVKNVLKEYKDTEKIKGTQLIFLDQGLTSDDEARYGFDLYTDIINKLIKGGINPEEIVRIDKVPIKKLEDLFDKMRSGEVRVLIGTTMRMGEGLNIQDRIVAMHELTPPAKPSGIEQSEGRAIRSGNMNKNVRIYRYIQEGSFDSYLWQQLERKGRFINVAMSGGAVNEIDDVDDAVLSYQEAKAIATGNPLLLEKAELDQKFNELESSYRWYMTQQISAQDTMANAPQALASAQKLLDARKADQETVNNNPVKDNKFSMTIEGKEYTERKTANEAIAKIFSNGKYALNHTYDIGSARGLTVQFLAQPGSFTLSVASKDFYTIPDAHADGDNATRIWNQLDKVESGQYVEPVENRIKKIQADIDEAKGILAKPYEHQQEYNDTLSRLHDVNIQLAAAAGNVTTEIIDEESDDFKGKFKTEEEKYEDELAEAEESADEEEGEDEATTPKRSSNRRNKVRKSLFKGRWGNGKHDKNAEIRSVNDLVDEAQRIFGIPINLGKMNAPRNARAIFKEFPETIRTRQYGDLSNIFHEVGHWFDKKYDLSTSPYVSTLTKEYEADLKQRGYEDEEITGESVAEYFREYLSNREETEDKFPKFTQWMYKQLNTRDNKGLLEYSGMTNAYFSADLERRADAQVHYRTDEDTILGNAQVVAEYLKEDPHGYLGGKGRDFMRAWFDDIHDLRGIARAYDLAFLARRANGIAAARLKYHMTDLNGNIVGPSLATILSDGQITDKATRKEFDKYLIARRALDHFMANTLGENLPTLVYADEELNNPDVLIDRIRRYDDMYPSFREASERLYALQNQMLDLAIEAGIMPTRGDMTMEDMKQRLNELYPHYVPLYRKMDDPQTKAVAGSKYGSKNSPIAHFKGSGRDIYSPIENIMINMAKYTSLSLVAQVKRNIYDFVTQNEGMGMIAEEVPASKILDRVSTDEIKKKLDALGKDVEALSYLSEGAKKDVLDTITEVIGDTTGQWKIKTKQGTNIMPVMVDGKVHYLEIHDEGLMKTLENLEPKQFNLLTRFMGSFTRFKKLFATGINAKFAATNVARDLNTGFVSSSTTNNPIKYGADFIKEFISTLMEDERFQYFQLQGGGYMGAYTHDYDLLRKLNEEVMNNAPNIKKVFRAITGIMMKLIESGENASRQAEFYRAVNKGFDNLDAFRMSQEVTVNFDRGGSYVKGINQYVPYRQAAFNAFYHTADLFASGGRGGRGGNGGGNNTNDSVSRNRRNAITKWIMLGIASALLTALLSYLIANKIKGESKEKILEEREKLSKYRKMNYWNIYIGDGKFLELRKETMLNAPLNTIERLVDYYVLDQGDALDGLAGDLVDAILPVDVLHPISDIVGGTSGLGTIYNLARNKDFKDTPIEPEWMERQNIPYRDRYSDTTSEVWKKLGEILNQSPIKMQYAIEDNFAFWGQTFDRATSKSGDVWAGFNNSFIADNVYSTDIINTFYNQKEKYDSPKKGEDELETDYGSWKYQQIAGMYSDLNKFYKNENDSDYARMMRSTTNNLILQVNRAGMTDLDKAVIETIRGNTTEIKDVCPYITPPDHYTEQKVQFDMGYEDKVTYYLQEQEMFKEGYAQILQSGYDNATTSAMLVAYHKEVNKQLDAYWKQLLIDRAVNGQ